MKKFTHINQHVEPLKAETTAKGRFYTSPTGVKYPSVTTVLGFRKPKGLVEWQNKVGKEVAQSIGETSARRGTRIHNICEQYLRNQLSDRRKLMPDIKESLKNLEPTLDRIDNIRLIEAALFCHKLKMAGRSDIIGEFDTVPSIIDFKTSLREKHEDYILDYFLQATAYALMYNRMFKDDIRQIVIIIQCDDMIEPQVFVKKIDEYIDRLYLKIIDYWKHNKGIE